MPAPANETARKSAAKTKAKKQPISKPDTEKKKETNGSPAKGIWEKPTRVLKKKRKMEGTTQPKIVAVEGNAAKREGVGEKKKGSKFEKKDEQKRKRLMKKKNRMGKNKFRKLQRVIQNVKSV